MRHLLLLSALLAAPALASDATLFHTAERGGPFDHTFGLGSYLTGWAGAYGGAGVGARIRVEPLSWLGADLFGEALIVESPSGLRHDHPIGFNLYVPFRLGLVRLRPLVGLCVVASLIEPTEPMAPRADDVLVGAHAGAGLDLALLGRLSLFAEAKALVWFGHDRALGGWTGAVGNDVRPFPLAQINLGFTLHL